MCSLLPTYTVLQKWKKKFKAMIFERLSSPPAQYLLSCLFFIYEKFGGKISIFSYFIYPVHARQSYIIYIEKKVKRSRQQFLVCLDLVLIDCFVTLQDLVVYGKK